MYATVGCPGQGGRGPTQTWQHGSVVAADGGKSRVIAQKPGGGTKHPVVKKCTGGAGCFGIVGNPLNTARAHAAVAVQGIVTDVNIDQPAIANNWAIKVIDHIPSGDAEKRGSIFFAHPIVF